MSEISYLSNTKEKFQSINSKLYFLVVPYSEYKTRFFYFFRDNLKLKTVTILSSLNKDKVKYFQEYILYPDLVKNNEFI